MLDVVEAVKRLRPALSVRFAEQDVLNHLSFLVDAERIRGAGWSPVMRLSDAVEAELEHFGNFGALPGSPDESLDSSA